MREYPTFKLRSFKNLVTLRKLDLTCWHCLGEGYIQLDPEQYPISCNRCAATGLKLFPLSEVS